MAFDPIKEVSDWWSRVSGNGKDSSAYDDFVRRMQELMDKPYKDSGVSSVPELPTYDKLNTDERTDKELEELAKNKLKEYEQNMKRQIEDSANKEADTLGKNKQKAEDAQRQAETDINSAYDKDKHDTKNDMSKRGLSRSSISTNSNERLDDNKDSALDSNQQKYGSIITELDREISGLEDKRNKALQDFDIVYAAKLTQNIAELVAERDKTNNTAYKYNNDLASKEQKDYADYLKNMDKYQSTNDAIKQKELSERQQQFFKEAKSVLSGLSPKEARDKLENDPIFYNLPQFMYTQLYKQFAM